MGIDAAIGAIADKQWGVFTTRQVRVLGGDHRTVQRRIAAGRWEHATRRVLRMAGAPDSPEQRIMIRVLDGGDDALASFHAAAFVWRLPGFVGHAEATRSRVVAGKRGHRPTLLPPHHRTAVRGIPVTTLPRTIFDLAGAGLPHGRLLALVDRVVTESPAMSPALHRTLGELAGRGRPGITVMRQILAMRPEGERVPASGLERRFEQICHNAGIRGLERQVDVGGHSWLGRADYRRRDVRLVVEIDSERHHTSVTDKANDAARDAAMAAAGWHVLRIWGEDVWQRPYLVVEALRGTIDRLLGTKTDQKLPVLVPRTTS